MFLMGAAVVVGAFLLFLVQPVAGKLLPFCGGSAAVWSACLFFFQTALLGGYGYAQWLAGRPDPRRQAVVHLHLVLVCVLALRAAPHSGSGSLHVLLGLAGAFDLPYFPLATTSPLMQHWLGRLNR